MMDYPGGIKAAVAGASAPASPIMITGDHKIGGGHRREIGILRDGTEAVEGAVIDGF